MNIAPALESVPADVVTLADHEAAARARLDPAIWAYLHGGAGDELTVRANRAAWDNLQLLPRVLRELVGGHTRLQLLGRTLAHPVLVAPVAFQRLAHADGELATVHAAAALGAGFVASTQSSVPLEAIAQAVRADPDRGPLWFQLYWQHDKGFNRELLQRAEAAGYEAIVLTVDAPVSGVRDQERRSGFRFPADVVAANLQALPPPTGGPLQPGESMVFDTIQANPTHDGYYLAYVPIGECRYSIGIRFGMFLQSAQIESVNFVNEGGYFATSPTREPPTIIPGAPLLEGAAGAPGGLITFEDENAFMLVPPPPRTDDTKMMLAVVFRPIALRLDAAVQEDAAAA